MAASKVYSENRSFLDPAKPPVFPSNGANTPWPLPDPGSKAAFKWSQLRLAISIQAGEPAAGGSGRDASARSLFIIRKACLLSRFGCCSAGGASSGRATEDLSGARRLCFRVFSISGSFLSSARPRRGRKSSRLGAGAGGAHPGQTSLAPAGTCLYVLLLSFLSPSQPPLVGPHLLRTLM